MDSQSVWKATEAKLLTQFEKLIQISFPEAEISILQVLESDI